MIITPQQRDSLLEAAMPLIKWINENGYIHNKVIVDIDSAELVEGVASVLTTEFNKD